MSEIKHESFDTDDIEAWRSKDIPEEICVYIKGGEVMCHLTPAEAINLGNFLIKMGRKSMEEKQT